MLFQILCGYRLHIPDQMRGGFTQRIRPDLLICQHNSRDGKKLFLTLLLLLSLSACGTASQTRRQHRQWQFPTEEPTVTDDGTETESGFPFTLTTKDGAEVTFTHVPERVIAANANAGDQLMALGLGDKIIATAYTNSRY